MALFLRQKKIHSMLYVSIVMASALLAGCNDDNEVKSEQSTQEKPLEINLLHINDSHSHLDEETASFLLETAVGKREQIEVSRGGFARVTALINQLVQTEKNAIKIHSGDAITGDLYFNLGEGEAEAALMNTVCFDSLTLGNHEFDNADVGLQKFIQLLNKNNYCKTPTAILSANVNFGISSPLYKTQQVKPYTIIEKEGQKIALIGLTIADKTKNSSRPNSDTTFANELITAQNQIDALKRLGINKIIIQSHLGYDKEQDLARKLSGVDVIVGGDSHTLLADSKLSHYGITPEGNYPTMTKNKDGDDVCIVQAWQYAYVVGQLKVNFDKDGKIQSCSGRANMLIGDNFKRSEKDSEALIATEIATIKQDIENSGILKMVTPDYWALNVLSGYKLAKNQFGLKQVATATNDLCLRRVPGTTKDASRSTLGDICNKSDFINRHGGDVQQLVAEAFYRQGKVFFNADLSIQNGGGVRADLPKGLITVENIYSVLPFKNTLVELSMTGQEVKDVLEDALDTVEKGSSGAYPYSGGLRWSVDLTQSKGHRLTNLQIRNADGTYRTFDLDQTYKVVTIDFLADGQDGYTSFKNINGNRRSDVGLDYAEAFLKYAESLSNRSLSRLNEQDYSTQSYQE